MQITIPLRGGVVGGRAIQQAPDMTWIGIFRDLWKVRRASWHWRARRCFRANLRPLNRGGSNQNAL